MDSMRGLLRCVGLQASTERRSIAQLSVRANGEPEAFSLARGRLRGRREALHEHLVLAFARARQNLQKLME